MRRNVDTRSNDLSRVPRANDGREGDPERPPLLLGGAHGQQLVVITPKQDNGGLMQRQMLKSKIDGDDHGL
jgi:hypothetical protein